MHSYKSQNVFVQITKCICTNHKMYFSNCKMYFYKSQNACVQIQWEVWLYVGSAWLSPVKGNTNTCHLLLLVVPTHRFHHLLRLWLCCLRLGLHRLQRKNAQYISHCLLTQESWAIQAKSSFPGWPKLLLKQRGEGRQQCLIQRCLFLSPRLSTFGPRIIWCNTTNISAQWICLVTDISETHSSN